MAAAQEFADLDHRRLSSRRPIRLVAHKNAVCLADEQPPIAVRTAVEHPSLTCHRRLPRLDSDLQYGEDCRFAANDRCCSAAALSRWAAMQEGAAKVMQPPSTGAVLRSRRSLRPPPMGGLGQLQSRDIVARCA